MKKVFEQFYYNNKSYVFYLEDQKIKYGYLDNNEIKNDLSKDEINIMNIVLNRTTISSDKKNYIKCGTTNYNNKIFRIMYDKDSGLKFFYEIKDNKYEIPTYEDNSYLMKLYNDNSILYNELNDYSIKQLSKSAESTLFDADKHKYLTSIIIDLGTMCICTTLIGISVARLGKCYEIKHESYDTSIEYSYNELCDEVDKNTKLNDKEKEVIKSSFSMLEADKNYVDMKHIEKNLKDIDIKYDNRGITGKMINSTCSVMAQYSVMDNDITVYCGDNIDTVNSHILFHELDHAYTIIPSSSLGQSLYETAVETSAAETCDISDLDSRAYKTESLELYALMELIGKEPIKEFQHSGNINNVVNALEKINDNEEDAINLIAGIDSITKESNKKNVDVKALQDVLNQNFDLMNKYCKLKFNKDISEYKPIGNYLYNDVFCKDVTDELGIITLKGYFDDNYIQEHPETKVYTQADIDKKTEELKKSEQPIPTENVMDSLERVNVR